MEGREILLPTDVKCETTVQNVLKWATESKMTAVLGCISQKGEALGHLLLPGSSGSLYACVSLFDLRQNVSAQLLISKQHS